jgi:hypothetical protein
MRSSFNIAVMTGHKWLFLISCHNIGAILLRIRNNSLAMAVAAMKCLFMVMLVLCAAFLLVIPAIGGLLALLRNYFRNDARTSKNV